MTPKERAAKAIAKLYDKLLPREPADKEIAEAILAAIAEPSEAMIDAMRALTIYDSTKAEVTALWPETDSTISRAQLLSTR